MQLRMIAAPLASILALVLALGGCGGSSGSETSSAPAPQTEAQSKSAAASPEAETPSEAESAATGDIPDNQVFLTFNNRPAGYSIRYPEGWARRGSAGDVTFQEKGNVIHIVVAKGGARHPHRLWLNWNAVRQSDPTVKVGKPERLTIAGAPVDKSHLHTTQHPRPGHRQATAADDRPLLSTRTAARSRPSTLALPSASTTSMPTG